MGGCHRPGLGHAREQGRRHPAARDPRGDLRDRSGACALPQASFAEVLESAYPGAAAIVAEGCGAGSAPATPAARRNLPLTRTRRVTWISPRATAGETSPPAAKPSLNSRRACPSHAGPGAALGRRGSGPPLAQSLADRPGRGRGARRRQRHCLRLPRAGEETATATTTVHRGRVDHHHHRQRSASRGPTTTTGEDGSTTTTGTRRVTTTSIPDGDTPPITPVGEPIPITELTLTKDDIGPLDFGDEGDRCSGASPPPSATPPRTPGSSWATAPGRVRRRPIRVVQWGPLNIVVPARWGAASSSPTAST